MLWWWWMWWLLFLFLLCWKSLSLSWSWQVLTSTLLSVSVYVNLWQLYITFSTYFGQMIAAAAPNQQVAQIIFSTANPILNTFSGFNITPKDIPQVRDHGPWWSLELVKLRALKSCCPGLVERCFFMSPRDGSLDWRPLQLYIHLVGRLMTPS
jgi:hypothetical protein